MTLATLPSPAERLAGLIDGLCKAVAAHGVRGLLTLPLLLLLWSRLSRMAQRARRLSKRMATGVPVSTPRPRAAPRSAPSHPYVRLPRGITWLVRAVPATASGAAALQFLLDQPDMAAVAHAPPMRRLLRPLCRMLGVEPPADRQTFTGWPRESPSPLAGEGRGEGLDRTNFGALATPPPTPSHKGRGLIANSPILGQISESLLRPPAPPSSPAPTPVASEPPRPPPAPPRAGPAPLDPPASPIPAILSNAA